MTEISPANPPSPFDSIRRTDDHGEFWNARELQTVMGYNAWRDFANAIDRAKITCSNSGVDVSSNFADARKISSTRTGEDYRLTRYAAYLVAMNGDPRKAEIAAAQTYFAVKTREAETAAALFDPSTLSRLDILKLAMQAEEEKAVLEAALESAAPAIEYVDRYVSDDDVLTVKNWAAQFGLTEPAARDLLLSKNIIYKHSIGKRWSATAGRVVDEHEYRAYAGRITFAWFDLRPQHAAPRHHNGQLRQTLYVRQVFALDLARKVGITPSQMELGESA